MSQKKSGVEAKIHADRERAHNQFELETARNTVKICQRQLVKSRLALFHCHTTKLRPCWPYAEDLRLQRALCSDFEEKLRELEEAFDTTSPDCGP